MKMEKSNNKLQDEIGKVKSFNTLDLLEQE